MKFISLLLGMVPKGLPMGAGSNVGRTHFFVHYILMIINGWALKLRTFLFKELWE